MATEACNCPGVSLNNWDRGESYAYDILGDLNNWAVGWVDWNQILDMQGGPNHVNNYCDANIVCDTKNQVFYYQSKLKKNLNYQKQKCNSIFYSNLLFHWSNFKICCAWFLSH